MKTTSSLPKLFQPVLATLAIAITCGISAPAQANYIVTLEQVGSNVVATGTGAFDLTGLTFAGSNSLGTGITPSFALAGIGPDGSVDEYDGTAPFAGPTNFGPDQVVLLRTVAAETPSGIFRTSLVSVSFLSQSVIRPVIFYRTV